MNNAKRFFTPYRFVALLRHFQISSQTTEAIRPDSVKTFEEKYLPSLLAAIGPREVKIAHTCSGRTRNTAKILKEKLEKAGLRVIEIRELVRTWSGSAGNILHEFNWLKGQAVSDNEFHILVLHADMITGFCQGQCGSPDFGEFISSEGED